MSFFEEKLPSDGQTRVCFRPYTIEDAIGVSSMNPKLKERFASRFLEIIQTGENPVDPRTRMTVRDRRTLLFKYALVSLEAEKLKMPEEYNIPECPLCGEKHVFHLSITDMAGRFKNRILKKEEARVRTEFEGTKLIVTPLRGEHAEQLELFDNRIEAIQRNSGEDSDNYQAVRVEKEIYQLLCRFSLDDSEETESDPEELETRAEKWLRGLSASGFERLRSLIYNKEREIEHGISFVYYHPCPASSEDGEAAELNGKEGLVACLLPFRFEEFIPRI